jgi:hypothetical protein
VLPPNFRDVTAERVGTVTGIVGGRLWTRMQGVRFIGVDAVARPRLLTGAHQKAEGEH